MSDWHRNSVVSRVDLGEVEMALEFLGEEDRGAIEVGVTRVSTFRIAPSCVRIRTVSDFGRE